MSDEKVQPETTLRRLVRFLPLAAIAAGLLLVVATGHFRSFTLASIVEQRDDMRRLVDEHYARAVITFVATYVFVVALSLPGALALTIMGGFLFGWAAGGSLAVLSASTGAVIVFLAARTSLGTLLAEKAGPRLSRVLAGFRSDAFSYLLFLRLVPIVPFWMVNLAPALAGIGLGTYALTTVIGILPGTFAFALAGDSLDSVIAAQKEAYQTCLAAGLPECRFKLHPRMLITPSLVMALAALGLLALVPVAARRWRARRAARTGRLG